MEALRPVVNHLERSLGKTVRSGSLKSLRTFLVNVIYTIVSITELPLTARSETTDARSTSPPGAEWLRYVYGAMSESTQATLEGESKLTV